MIEELKLISRSNNEISYPNSKWERLNKIYVTGILNLGLSDKVHFDMHNCPKLNQVINWIHNIRHSRKSEADLNCKEGRIIIKVLGGEKFQIFKFNQDGTKRLITEKTHYSLPGTNLMLESIWRQIVPLNRKLRNIIALKLIDSEVNRSNENGLSIGDRVITKESVKNKREGIISWIEYHLKDNKTYNYVMINGIQHNRRYETNEIQLNEYDR